MNRQSAWVVILGLFCCAQNQPSRSPSIRGKVTGPDGRAVAQAQVSLRAAGAEMAVPVISASDGSFLFGPVKVNVDYELSAQQGGLASVVTPLRVSGPDEKVTINLKMGPVFQFEDIAAKAGIGFTLRNGAAGHAWQPEIMLGGVAALDYNNDGCTDIFFTNGAALPSLTKTGPEFYNRLYRNNCDSTFTDVTEKAGMAGSGYSMGVATGDFDADGFVDVLVTGVSGLVLYRNGGDGTFQDVTAQAGLGTSRLWSASAGWFDYDNDGYPDLFVTNYVTWTPASDQGCSTAGVPFYCHPRVYQGLPNQLFHNNRDGTFTDVSESSGIRASVGKGMGMAFGDYDGDGFTDVFVANDSAPNFLFRNLGNGKFRETAVEAGAAYLANGKAVASMGADFRDFDDDGHDDIAVTAMYFDTFPLFRNRGKPGFFADDTASSGVAIATRNLTAWGMGMFDLDNDGRKDLFFAASHFPGSEPYVHSPAETPNHVLRNIGTGYFEDVSESAGKDFQSPALFHGAAFADFDNDGRVDVVVTAVNGAARLFRNTSPARSHWLALRIPGTGARVKLTLPTGAVQYNHATTSVGYASSSEALVRFGMGPYDRASKIEIRWPGGRVQVLKEVKADEVITLPSQR